MKKETFQCSLSKSTDDELYRLARKYLIQEQIGLRHNSWKCDMVYDECSRRNKNIFLKSLEDAMATISSLDELPGGMKVVHIRRIDYMTKDEILSVLQTAGAAVAHEMVDDSDSAEPVSIFSVFGIRSQDVFLCRVSGLSMLNADIKDGDTLVVDCSQKPESGKIIVAVLNGSLFVKKYMIDNGNIWLISENTGYRDFLVKDGMDFHVFGVVRHVIHSI